MERFDWDQFAIERWNGHLRREIDGWFWSDGTPAPIYDIDPRNVFSFRTFRMPREKAGKQIVLAPVQVMIPRSLIQIDSLLAWFRDNQKTLDRDTPKKLQGDEHHLYVPLSTYNSWAANFIPGFYFRDEDYIEVRSKVDRLPGVPVDWSSYERYRRYMRMPAYRLPIQCA